MMTLGDDAQMAHLNLHYSMVILYPEFQTKYYAPICKLHFLFLVIFFGLGKAVQWCWQQVLQLELLGSLNAWPTLASSYQLSSSSAA